jgi:serine/threonine protein kinase
MIGSEKAESSAARLTLLCPGCGTKLHTSPRFAGKSSRCPKCKQNVQVPAVSARNVVTKSVRTENTPPATRVKTPVAGLPQLPGYEVLRKIGQGGMGAVYAARQENLNRIVAIKTILVDHQPQTVARFEKEAQTVAMLQHPNIVAAHDFGRHEGRLFLVMELLDGESLETFVAQRGPQPEVAAWGLIRQVAAGLAHAAQFDIVHRDIKPANLFLVDPPTGFPLPAGVPLVKITDFGLALLAEPAAGQSRLTQAGFALGTPAYMAPEQFNTSDVDCRADIYALGATAYFVLHGLPPFPQDTFWQIMLEKNAGRRPQVAPTLSPDSRALLDSMMAAEPAGRPASYQELIERIDRISAGLVKTRTETTDSNGSKPEPAPASAPAVDLHRRTWTFHPWFRPLLALLLGGTAILTLFAVLVWSRAPKTATPTGPTLAASGWIQPLFNGASLADWSIEEGVWMVAKDAEGGQVLSGKGVIRRALPPLAYYRVTLGIDLAKASAVEVQFGVHAANGGQPRYVLRIAPDGVIAGSRTGDRGELQVRSSTFPFPAGQPGAASYREARIERDDSNWWVYFNSELIARLPVVPETDLMQLRLVTEGEPALFDAPEAAELVDAPR